MPPHTQGTLTVSPDPPLAFESTATFTATGLEPNDSLVVKAYHVEEGWTAQSTHAVDGDGNSTFEWYMSPSGTYNFSVEQQKGNRWWEKARLDGVVVS